MTHAGRHWSVGLGASSNVSNMYNFKDKGDLSLCTTNSSLYAASHKSYAPQAVAASPQTATIDGGTPIPSWKLNSTPTGAQAKLVTKSFFQLRSFSCRTRSASASVSNSDPFSDWPSSFFRSSSLRRKRTASRRSRRNSSMI